MVLDWFACFVLLWRLWVVCILCLFDVGVVGCCDLWMLVVTVLMVSLVAYLVICVTLGLRLDFVCWLVWVLWVVGLFVFGCLVLQLRSCACGFYDCDCCVWLRIICCVGFLCGWFGAYGGLVLAVMSVGCVVVLLVSCCSLLGFA